MGVVVAIKKKVPAFKVTPKGKLADRSLSWTVLYPYIALIIVSALPGILIQRDDDAVGYHFFLLFAVLMYVALVISILILHHREIKR